ncbi:MAG: YeeE/YedE family protein [Sandaracinus sp.]|nr:YeeE/YedE family protein [Myxococcales bacterium]MCB9602607.1 YeeE/YedE family protein [Sandaracinus sp.]MCB9617923.1 YeeE/YedE family protein [Sandaracinus sp.]MCB9635421.1 YeeE/YedE family protein [Sandaracinus sp.]
MSLRPWLPTLVGFVLAVALGLSRLTRPEVIVGWLDPSAWDPTVLFVMIGAVSSFALVHRLARARRPNVCPTPTKKALDLRLVGGSVIFGLGWGLGGVCPGPALTSLGAGASWTPLFVASMVVGLWLGAPERWRAWGLAKEGKSRV